MKRNLQNRVEMAPNLTQDRLSNLPDGILGNIFSSLSIRDVVRTCSLSTEWRYKWVSSPHLIFDDECIPGSVGSSAHCKLVEIVSDVLMIHRGPILTFSVSGSHLQSCSKIDTWLFSLSVGSLSELELMIWDPSHRYRVPCLFSFKHLTDLTLSDCIIVPPSTFRVFRYLANLFLEDATVSDASMKCLVSSCPELESLTLLRIDGLTRIELGNPKLKEIYIYGQVISLCLNDLTHLVFAAFLTTSTAPPDQQRICNFRNILASLLGIQELRLGGYYLQSLAINDISKRLPYKYDHLESISLELTTKDTKEKEIFFAVYLLISSPSLQEFRISLGERYSVLPHHENSESLMYLEETMDQLGSTFKKLRDVAIFEFHGTETELVLVKFILSNSPVLERMEINSELELPNSVLKELVRLKRVSTVVEVVIGPHSQPFFTNRC